MKKILVPTDLSEIAERGLRLAVEIAKRIDAQIYLMNFINHPFGRTFSAMGEVNSKVDVEEQRFNLELIRANKEKLLLLGQKYANGVTINTEIVDSNLKEGVDAYLKMHSIDLVVMGTSGEENLKEQFTGNHTEQVISMVSCPVISIRDNFDITRFNNMVLAVDIMLHSKIEPGIEVIKEFAESFDSTIHLVHVSDTTVRMEKNLEKYFTEIAAMHKLKKYKVVILTGDNEAEKVNEYARTINAGMLAVLKNNNDRIWKIFTDHFSDQVVKEVGQPVLTYNLQAANKED